MNRLYRDKQDRLLWTDKVAPAHRVQYLAHHELESICYWYQHTERVHMQVKPLSMELQNAI